MGNNMITMYLTAIVSMAVLLCCWLAVQRLWHRQFPGQAAADGDALAKEITTEVTRHAP